MKLPLDFDGPSQTNRHPGRTAWWSFPPVATPPTWSSIGWLGLAVTMLALGGCQKKSETSTATAHIPVRIGWQTTWSTQGQIAQVLARTTALQKNGLEGTFLGVTYGAPLNEAAVAGSVDVIFTADQPAAALLARGARWLIIGRLMFNRVAVYVPPESPIRSIAELKAKRIAVPFGAAAQRVAYKAIADAGVNPTEEVQFVNLDITEQTALVNKGTPASWGDIDAMAGFDPTLASLENAHQVRLLYTGRVTSLVVMSRNFIEKYPEAPVRFLRAFGEASFYYAGHDRQANEWFRTASRLKVSDEVLALAASVEPNLKAKAVSEIRFRLTPELVQGLQEAANFLYDHGLIKTRVTISDHVDQSYAARAEAELSAKDLGAEPLLVK